MHALQSPSLDLFEAFFEMASDYARATEARYQRPGGWDPHTFRAYIQQLQDWSKGINLLPSLSPESSFWLVEDNRTIVGVSRLRMTLTDDLRKQGGNIGYDVPPSRRRKGYGSELLRQTIARARQLGLDRLLVTCDMDNMPSRRIIVKNGSIEASEGILESSGKPILRFWIG